MAFALTGTVVLPAQLFGLFHRCLSMHQPAMIEHLGLGVGVQTIAPHGLHPRRGYVQKQPLQELIGRQGHDIRLAAPRLILVVVVVVLERNFACGGREQLLRCYPSGKDSGIPVACSVTCGEQPIGTWTLVESSGCKRDGVAVGIALA